MTKCDVLKRNLNETSVKPVSIQGYFKANANLLRVARAFPDSIVFIMAM